MNSPEPNDTEKKHFPIQRKRLGVVRFYREDTEYGFIEAEDFREDVFFHRRDWHGIKPGDETNTVIEPEANLWVEFELDDEHFRNEKKLRAKTVYPTDRPRGRKLSGRDATFQIMTHHPNARRKRPTWRK